MPAPATRKKHRSAATRLMTIYSIALSVIAIVSVAGQIAIQTALNRQAANDRFCVAAGQQEMLGQRMALTALAVQAADTPAVRAAKSAELRSVNDTLSLGLPGHPSARVSRLWNDATPAHQAMQDEAQAILAALPPEGSSQKPDLYRYLTPLLQNEAQFQPGMERIVRSSELEAQAQTLALRRTAGGLVALTLLTVIAAIFLTLRPLAALRQAEESASDQQAALGEADRQLAQMRAMMENLSPVDMLTGLNNHRAFHEHLDRELGRALRHGHALSLLLLDVDRFKTYNDAYGHRDGDEALKMVGRVLADNARTSDIPARYGGEEFAVILTETDTMGAVVLGERVRQAIASSDCLQRPLTASIGIATLTPSMCGVAELIAQADRALCHAKGEGRNRVSHVSRLPNPVEETWRFLPDREMAAA